MKYDSIGEYVNNFRHLCLKEFMRRIRVTKLEGRVKESPAWEKQLEKDRELLGRAESEIAAYSLPQQIKEVIHLSAYRKHVAIMKEIISEREIFGDCLYCERADLSEKRQGMYCLEFKRDCFEMEKEKRMPCIKFSRIDPSKADEVRRKLMRFEESGDEESLKVARVLLERAEAEFSAKYKQRRGVKTRLPPYQGR